MKRTPGRGARRGCGAGWALASCWPLWALSSAFAQTTAPDVAGPGLRIEPTVTVTQTLSDISGSRSRTDWITQISPRVRISGQRGRVRGHFDYSLQGLTYRSNAASSELRHRLSAAVTAEVIEDRFFVDAQASVAQAVVSAFGLQTPDPALPNDNQAEQRSFRVAPVLRGRLAGEVDYLARLSYAATRTDSVRAFDGDIAGALLNLRGGTPLRTVGWSLDATHDTYDFSAASRKTEAQRLRLQATYAPIPSLQVSLIGGHEVNDLRTLDKQGYDNVGWALDWRPGQRTRLFAQQEKRFFGTGYSVIAEHRTARTILRFSDRRDISTPLGGRTLATIGTVFDVYFAQFASIEPDPVLRAIAVTNFLLSRGIDPNTPVVAGFLTSSLTLTRDQQLSAAWRGVRQTVTVLWRQTWSRRADTISVAADDFTNTALVHQRGLSVSVSHRLTPLSTLNLLGAYTRSQGDLATQDNNLRSLTLTWGGQLAENLAATLGVRHSEFSSSTQPRTENAVIGSLTMRF